MKKIISIFLFLLITCTTNAQVTQQRTCGTPVPDSQWDNWFNSKVDEYKADKAAGRIATVNYTIPIIVHVLHNGDAVGSNENISYTQIQSAIAALNADFAGTNSDIVNVPQVFQGVKAGNTGISFCLAQVNPSGTILSEPGVERINWATRGWSNPGGFLNSGEFQNYINSTIKPASIWDPTKYLNVWVVDVSPNMPNRLLGYATFPLGSGLSGISNPETATNSGLVIRYDVWGTVGNLDPSYNKNRTATHEIGHWLGLRHIWGDGNNCRGSDFCGDTPPQSNENYGCKTHPYNLGVCSGNTTGEMFMNFMDYGDDPCIIMFTQDQADRIQTAMLNGVYRNPLSFSTVCQTPSIVYDVRLNASVVPSSTSIIYGSSFSVTTNFVNRGNSTFNGDFCAAVFDNNNNFISFIQTLTNYTLQVNNTYVNNQTFSTTGIFEMIPGSYKIGIFYRPTGGGWLQCGNNGSYINLVPITVINPKPIELYSSINISPGTTLTQTQPVTITIDLANTGTTTFVGQYQVNLYNLDGTFSETINTITTPSTGLPPNSHYNSPFLVFSKNSISSQPGDYLLAIMYKSNSQSTFELAGSTYFTNPILVNILAPSPDSYEVNNTFAQSYSMPISFPNQTTVVNTTGSNFHNSTDEDYYKLTLPPGYNYSISPRLHDSYNSGNGNTYSADAKFIYSTDGGVSWSAEIDDILTSNITLNGGGTVYFHVSPYFTGQTGNYLLDISVSRSICPPATISPSGTINICSANPQTLTSSSNFGNQWYLNGNVIPGATFNTYNASGAGSYTVVTTINNCTSSPSTPVIITVTQSPSTPSISWNGTQFSTTATGVTYQWYLNGSAIAGATSANYTPTSIGVYKVMVTANGCSSSSDNYTLVVTGIDPTLTLSPYTAQVYPNPAKNDFAIKFAETPDVTIDIQLVNNLGVVIKSIKTKSNLTTIKVNELPAGIYFIKIIGGSYNQVKKIEVIK